MNGNTIQTAIQLAHIIMQPPELPYTIIIARNNGNLRLTVEEISPPTNTHPPDIIEECGNDILEREK